MSELDDLMKVAVRESPEDRAAAKFLTVLTLVLAAVSSAVVLALVILGTTLGK